MKRLCCDAKKQNMTAERGLLKETELKMTQLNWWQLIIPDVFSQINGVNGNMLHAHPHTLPQRVQIMHKNQLIGLAEVAELGEVFLSPV